MNTKSDKEILARAKQLNEARKVREQIEREKQEADEQKRFYALLSKVQEIIPSAKAVGELPYKVDIFGYLFYMGTSWCEDGLFYTKRKPEDKPQTPGTFVFSSYLYETRLFPSKGEVEFLENLGKFVEKFPVPENVKYDKYDKETKEWEEFTYSELLEDSNPFEVVTDKKVDSFNIKLTGELNPADSVKILEVAGKDDSMSNISRPPLSKKEFKQWEDKMKSQEDL